MRPDNHAVSAFFSVLSFVLPISPFMLGNAYISSTQLTALLFLVAIVVFFIEKFLFSFSFSKKIDSKSLGFIVSVHLLMVWLVFSGIYSIGYDTESFSISLRALLLLPFIVCIAFLGAQNLSGAIAAIIAVSGITVIIQCWYYFMFADASSSFVGVEVDGKVKYQTITFYSGILSVYCFAVLFHRPHFLKGIMSCLFAFLGVIAMTSAGGRAALVALVVVLLLLLSRLKIKRLFIYLVILGVGLITFLLFFDTVIVSRFQVLLEGGDSSSRLFLFSKAISLWLSSVQTFIFGDGLAAYPFFIGLESEDGVYPHNFVLEILAESGIIGVGLLGVNGYIFGSVFRSFDKKTADSVFIAYLPIYVLSTYMFIGGIRSLFIVYFYVTLSLFCMRWMKRANLTSYNYES